MNEIIGILCSIPSLLWSTLTEQEKFAAVDKAVPTTLPLSSIPSKNELIMSALTPIIHKRQTPRVTREMVWQTHDKELPIC